MMRCPNCGAVLIYNNEKRIYVCEYCGYNEVVLEKIVYQPVVQAPKYNYNLLISNRATAPIAKIRFTIATRTFQEHSTRMKPQPFFWLRVRTEFLSAVESTTELLSSLRLIMQIR